MNNTNQFDWVDFYTEFAAKLLQFKNNRSELVEKVLKIYENPEIKLPNFIKDNEFVDIDPFTVFGLFNKSGMSDTDRKTIISAIKEIFNISAPVPTSFDGIPVLLNFNKNATYYNVVDEHYENDIDNLWEYFDAALAYASASSSDNRAKISKYFDLTINIMNNKKGKITMGIYWIAPDVFLNLDDTNVKYIYESGKMPNELVDKLPKISKNTDKKISAETYFDILEKMHAFLQSDESEFNDFKELSYAAWQYSNQVKQEKKEREKMSQAEKDNVVKCDDKKPSTTNEEIIDTTPPTNEPYTKSDFLNEVFITESEYDKLRSLLLRKKNIILQGAPGVGKTFSAKRLAYSIMGEKNDDLICMVQFHQNYSYEDFIMGYRPNDSGGFSLQKGIFFNFCEKCKENPGKEYFFIIDEINRGNLSKIFGELMMLIETDKRGEANKLNLVYEETPFYIPENLHIIGMMNTADRSLAMIDYALRRRFSFYTMQPAFENAENNGFNIYRHEINCEPYHSVISKIKELNVEIRKDPTLGKGFEIGHSYFAPEDKSIINDEWVKNIVEFEIIPLLEEYWFDDDKKVEEWTKALYQASGEQT